MLKNKAVQKVSILNPPTILVHKIMISAFITNKNKPNVRIVTGKVKITNMGLIKIFSNPNTIATNNAVVKLSTCTPGIKFEISKTKAAVIIILISRFIIFKFKF